MHSRSYGNKNTVDLGVETNTRIDSLATRFGKLGQVRWVGRKLTYESYTRS